MLVIPALRRLRQKRHKFKASLGYIAKDLTGYVAFWVCFFLYLMGIMTVTVTWRGRRIGTTQ
jgi:uncharacterized membrane protein